MCADRPTADSPAADFPAAGTDPALWNRTWASTATAQIAGLDQRIFDALASLLDVRGMEVLELGAGSGHLCRLMLDAGARGATLVDFSATALGRARRELTGVGTCRFVQADLFDLPEDPRYGLVFSSGLAEHFSGEARELVVRKHLALSRKWVCFIVPARPHPNTFRHRRARTRDLYGWQRAFSVDELTGLITAGGAFEVTASRRILPLYGVTLLDLLGAREADAGRSAARAWNGLLRLKDRVLARAGFYAGLERILARRADRWGGLLIIVARRLDCGHTRLAPGVPNLQPVDSSQPTLLD